jgi:hypothetical protein
MCTALCNLNFRMRPLQKQQGNGSRAEEAIRSWCVLVFFRAQAWGWAQIAVVFLGK